MKAYTNVTLNLTTERQNFSSGETRLTLKLAPKLVKNNRTFSFQVFIIFLHAALSQPPSDGNFVSDSDSDYQDLHTSARPLKSPLPPKFGKIRAPVINSSPYQQTKVTPVPILKQINRWTLLWRICCLENDGRRSNLARSTWIFRCHRTTYIVNWSLHLREWILKNIAQPL